MKNILYILIGLISLVCCKQQTKSDIGDINADALTTNQSFTEFRFRLLDISQEDFEILERNDTAFFIKKSYEGIDGDRIQFDSSVISEINAKVKFDFGFLQYTIDDNPAIPLEFTKQSKWADLKSGDGIIEIPDFYGNTENPKVFEVLGFEGTDEIIKWIEIEDFETIKSESIKKQTDFFKGLLTNKSQYESCCPEYIEQANDFLKTKDFESVNQLDLELIYKEMVIVLEGKLLDGTPFHKVIIEKNKAAANTKK